jgi:hypothetical protein
MDRPALTLALAALACLGCGEPAAEPPASESAAPMLGAAPRPDELEAAVARAQARLAQAPAIVRFLDPSGGAVNLDEAAKRLAPTIAACRADQKVLAAIADELADTHPDVARAPVAAVLARERASAFRFREWVLLELLKTTDGIVSSLRARGAGPAEMVLAAAQLDTIAYPREGVALLRRWLEIAPEALRRAPPGSRELATALADARMMAFAWGPNQWSAKDAVEVRGPVAALRAALRGLPVERVVARWWDWGEKNGGAPLDPSTASEQAKDLRALGVDVP